LVLVRWADDFDHCDNPLTRLNVENFDLVFVGLNGVQFDKLRRLNVQQTDGA
jgi:hypothetical protein